MKALVMFSLNIPKSIEEQAKENNDPVLHNARGWIADMLAEAFSSPSIHRQTADFYDMPLDSPVRGLEPRTPEEDAADETQVRIIEIIEQRD